MPDYIPGGDAEFSTWQANFVTYANANLAALGLVAADLTPIVAAQPTWTASLTAHVAAQANAQSKRAAKDASRTALETLIRALVRRLQASPAVNDAERQSLGINVRDTTPTTAGAPISRPVVKVDSSQRMRHVIAFADAATPTRTAKPAGVMGAEIWVKIGDPVPTDPNQCTFLALDSRTPYTADYAGADGGKTAHYMLRWVSTNGDKGPWSETASATIGA